MRKVLVLMWLAAMVIFAMGQSWETVRYGDMEYSPNAIEFVDALTGLFVSDDGAVVGTTDGGLTGATLRMPDDTGLDWDDVMFANAMVGYSCGESGIVFKTTDGGLNWMQVNDTNYTDNLYNIAVVSEDLVYAAGKAGALVKTTDGGTTWTKSGFAFGEDLDGGLAFLNADTGVVVMDGLGGKTWYTHDGGDNWTEVAVVFPPLTASNRLYDVAAGGNKFVVSGYGYCVFISTDFGQSYTLANDYTFGYDRMTELQILDDDHIFATGTDGYTIKSTDGGATWDTLYTGSGQTPAGIDFVSANDGFVFQTYGQWFRTNDGGASFTPLLDWPSVSFWGLATPSDDKIVVTGWGGGELTMSTDGGQTWTYPDNLLTKATGNLYEIEFLDEQTGIIGGEGGKIWKSTDGGLSWALIDNPMYLDAKIINGVSIIDGNTLLAGGSSSYMMKSTDGGDNWELIVCQTASSTTIYDFWAINPTQVIATGSTGRILLSNATVDTFKQVMDYGSMTMRAVEFRGDVGIVVASSGSVFRTTVAEWDTLVEVFTEPDGDDFYDVEFITDSLVYIVGENGKIYKSEDAGLTWMAEMSYTEATLQKVLARNDKIWTVGKDGAILMLDLDPEPPFVSTVIINELMFDVTSDDGATPDVNEGDINGDGQRSVRGDEFVELYNAGDVAEDISGYQLLKRDLAVVFTFPENTVLEPGEFAVVFGGVGPNGFGPQFPDDLKLFAAKPGEADSGFAGNDGTTNLQGGNDNMILFNPAAQATIAEIYWGSATPKSPVAIQLAAPNTVGDATISGAIHQSVTRSPDITGLWDLHTNASPKGYYQSPGTFVDSAYVSIEHNGFGNLPAEYKLSQNYPNPFNPVTTIEYSIKKAGQVTMTVYSVTGQKIATLINERLDAGTGKVVWNAGSLASGIYFYELKSGDFVSVKKLVLMK